MMSKFINALMFSASAAALTMPAHAQTVEPEQAADPVDVNEIVVTGTLRSATLQQVPIAVTAVTAEEFRNSAFKEVRELELLSPGIQISRQGGQGIFIRGSGTASQNAGTEQSVGMVIDGVLMGFVDDIGGDISDLAQIEVYRGPQGTQFAKNASAGVVAVTTKKPVIGKWAYTGRLAYGEHNDTNATGTVNIPINDYLAARVTGSFQHRDGVFENLSIGKKQGGRRQYGVRGKVLWNPDVDKDILLGFDYRREHISPNFPQAFRKCGPGGTAAFPTVFGTAASPNLLPPCLGVLAVGVEPSKTNSTSGEMDPGYRNTQSGGVSLEVGYPLGDYRLFSLTAYRFMERDIFGPNGSGTFNNQFNNRDYSASQLSQEFRLISPSDRPLTFVLGAFLYKRDTDTNELPFGQGYGVVNSIPAAVAYGPGAQVSSYGGRFTSNNVITSAAGYADGSYHFTPEFQVNAGLRVTRDHVKATGHTTLVPGIFQLPGTTLRATDADSVSATGVTARIGPQYFITRSVQLYGTYARGYKGPLVDNTVQNFGLVKPETVDAFEAGIKSSWFGGQLTVNLAAFNQKFKNYQVATLNTNIVPNTFQLGNAGGQLSRGFELEGTVRPVRALTFNYGVAFLDAKYTDFVTSCYTTPANFATSGQTFKQPQITDPSGKGGCYTQPGTSVRYTNAAGFPLINASKWTMRIGATYSHELPSGAKVDASGNFLYRTKFYSTAPDPNLVNDGYGIAGFNAGYTAPGGTWRLGVFARNAFNQFFTAAVQSNTSDNRLGGETNVLNIEAVRTLGVSVDLNF
ncbi:MAG: TonB-dependent receptor [Sphingobium sp.]